MQYCATGATVKGLTKMSQTLGSELRCGFIEMLLLYTPIYKNVIIKPSIFFDKRYINTRQSL